MDKALLVDLMLDDGGILHFYIPQPSYDRVKGCVAFFRHIFNNREELTPFTLGVDWDWIVEELSLKTPTLALNLQGVVEEALLTAKVLTDKGEEVNGTGTEIFNTLSEDQKALLKGSIAFQYALLRYVPQSIAMKELSELYTALSFAEYKKHFMQSIEAMGEKSSKEKKQKG